MKNTQRRSSNKKKLVSAISMLTVSAVMLSTATYAWFTMSKEVEIKNIQVTATAPENIQMSLGLNQFNAGLTPATTLTAINTTNPDGVGIVAAPANTDDSKDWANTVAFYDYYQVGKLTPASSNTGGTIYYTNAMNGVGRTIEKTGGTSIAATDANKTGIAFSTTAENVTPITNSEIANTEGYYMDFPVWFRSSKAADTTMKVSANVTVGGNTAAKGHTETDNVTPALYKAARVTILNGTESGGSVTWATSSNVIVPTADNTAQSNKYYAGKALSGVGDISSTGAENNRSGAYDAPTLYNGTSAVVTINGTTATATTYHGNCTDSSTIYGNATCIIVRVWLEGEDTDCWNATEGQDFALSLKFEEITGS